MEIAAESAIEGEGAIEPHPQHLFEQFARGDPDAFEAVFRQYQNEVYGWILAIVRDRAAAEDLTIETFWRIHRAHARFDPARPFGAWARRIATNAALAHLKRRRPSEELPANLAAEPEADGAMQGELAGRIEGAFQALPAPMRIVARLALIEERPYQEIAGALGLSIGAVKTRVFRAVRVLRKELSDWEKNA